MSSSQCDATLPIISENYLLKPAGGWARGTSHERRPTQQVAIVQIQT